MNDALPAWVGSLRAHAGLADLGIQWLDGPSRRGVHRMAVAGFETREGHPAWMDRGRARMQRSLPLALGPERRKRLSGAECTTALFFDPERPDRVQLSLSASMSPLVWAEGEATPEGLRALFDRCFAEGGPVAALPRRFRTMIDFGEADRARIEEALTHGEPLLDDAGWYSLCADDPWLGFEDASPMELDARLRFAHREHGARFRSFAFRTLFSRSAVRVEQHPFGLWVVEIAYGPSPDHAGMRAVNEIFGTRLPEDLPADLAGASIMQGGHTSLAEIDEMEARGDPNRFTIVARSALAPGEPETSARLRAHVERFAGDEPMLEFVVNIASRYQDHAAIIEAAARASGSHLARTILDLMSAPEPGRAKAAEIA